MRHFTLLTRTKINLEARQNWGLSDILGLGIQREEWFMKPHSFSLDKLNEGLAVISITLGAELTPDNLKAMVEGVIELADRFEGSPFTVMMDTRPVKKASREALDALQALEMELAGKGVERIAHLVRFPEMAPKLKKTYADLGYPDLYGTFTDVGPAHKFLEGNTGADAGAQQ